MGDNKGRHERPRRYHRLVIAGLVAVLVVTAVQVSRMAACAERRPYARETGRAAFYQDFEHGNCSLDARGDLVVSVSTEEYAGSAACGGYLDVTGPRGTIRVQVVDRCPGCRPGDLDMSRTAFARIAPEAEGVAHVVYYPVRNPSSAKTLSFRVKRGSTRFWLAIQVLDHGNPLARVEVQNGARWQALTRGWDNYWVAPQGLGEGPFTVRVTDVYGNSATARDIQLQPDKVQHTSERLYPTSAPEVPDLPDSTHTPTHQCS